MSQEKPDKPTSDARIAANRANAAKSTGPKTPEGKAVSSMNALKHGLTARHVVVLDDPDEDPAEFDNLLDALIDEHQPDGVTERFLVERIATCYWRLRRALRYEAQSAADCLLARQQDLSGQTPAGPTADPLSDDGPIITLIRYESMIDRQLNRAMAQLAYLRQTRPTVVSPRQDAPSPAARLDPPARRSLGEGANPGEGGSPSRGEAPNEANPGASGKAIGLRQPAIIGLEAQRQALCPLTGG